MDNRNSRLPVPLKPRPLTRRTSMTPTVWEQAAPVVARGAFVVAAGLIGEWLLRSFARNAFSTPSSSRKPPTKGTALVRKPDDSIPEGTISISETTVIMRRLIIRR
jgi:hypothetical protein